MDRTWADTASTLTLVRHQLDMSEEQRASSVPQLLLVAVAFARRQVRPDRQPAEQVLPVVAYPVGDRQVVRTEARRHTDGGDGHIPERQACQRPQI